MKGDINLNNLKIKPSAFEDLHPKIKVVSGSISALKIKMKYLKLYSEPVLIKIDNLMILLG